jgi:hypothetical protein
MSFHVFFDMSTGLSKDIKVPKGTIRSILDRIESTQRELGYEFVQYKDNPKYWNKKVKDGVSDKVLCNIAEQHNTFVRILHHDLEEWSENPPNGEIETITPEESAKFWYGLTIIEVPAARWTGDYYTARMQAVYAAMRGIESEGMVYDSKPLTTKQAADVINLFAPYLDLEDRRLEVPKGRDYLASSYDGGYTWCEKCGAITEEDAEQCKKRKCPIQAEWIAEENGRK